MHVGTLPSPHPVKLFLLGRGLGALEISVVAGRLQFGGSSREILCSLEVFVRYIANLTRAVVTLLLLIVGNFYINFTERSRPLTTFGRDL